MGSMGLTGGITGFKLNIQRYNITAAVSGHARATVTDFTHSLSMKPCIKARNRAETAKQWEEGALTFHCFAG